MAGADPCDITLSVGTWHLCKLQKLASSLNPRRNPGNFNAIFFTYAHLRDGAG
jgi:hypothetical protein